MASAGILQHFDSDDRLAQAIHAKERFSPHFGHGSAQQPWAFLRILPTEISNPGIK
jgi:hypothetical protein